MIEDIRNSIGGNSNINKEDMETTDELFSYYDLLSFLKRGITFKRISLTAFDKEVIYIYDVEGNYVLEDRNNESFQFGLVIVPQIILNLKRI